MLPASLCPAGSLCLKGKKSRCVVLPPLQSFFLRSGPLSAQGFHFLKEQVQLLFEIT